MCDTLCRGCDDDSSLQFRSRTCRGRSSTRGRAVLLFHASCTHCMINACVQDFKKYPYFQRLESIQREIIGPRDKVRVSARLLLRNAVELCCTVPWYGDLLSLSLCSARPTRRSMATQRNPLESVSSPLSPLPSWELRSGRPCCNAITVGFRPDPRQPRTL
jgi:hypothetical protein